MSPYTCILPSQDAGTTTLYSDGVLTWAYSSLEFSVVLAVSNVDNYIYFQGSDDNATWDDIRGSRMTPYADNVLNYYTINNPLQKYIRCVVNRRVATAITGIFVRPLAKHEPDYSLYSTSVMSELADSPPLGVP